MEITKEWIDQQRAVCEAATPGPWESKHYGRYEDHDECCIALTDDSIEPSKYENADFIAAARTALPAALDALEASMQREAEKDAEIERMKGELAAEKRREDAAVKDIALTAYRENKMPCAACAKELLPKAACSGCCKLESLFEWRGLCAAKTDAPSGAESEAPHE